MTDTANLEKAIIGCILNEGHLFGIRKGTLTAECFKYSRCCSIYKAMTLLEYNGWSIDPIMVITKLSSLKDSMVEEEYIYMLANEAPPGELFREYVDCLIFIRNQEKSLIDEDKKILSIV